MFQSWPEQHTDLSPEGLLKAYSEGWTGVFKDEEAEEELRHAFYANSGFHTISDAAHDHGWADSGAGKLVIPYIYAEKLWPGCFPGDAQLVGSCVSHSTAKALQVTLACEIAAGKPDPVTGLVEGAPEVPAEGIKSGVVHPSPIYWTRGYSSHGWSCPTAANRVVNKVGIVICKNYPDLGVDLTNVTRSIETMYGSRSVPQEWETEFAKHRVRAAAEANSAEEIRDLLFNGYGISTCGSEGYSSTRDENGVSKRSGRWAHAMAAIGFDDRAETKERYNEPLVLICNSWGLWNRGGRKIMNSEYMIPEGAFWTPWSHCKNRYFVAFSNVMGWPSRKLPDLGATGII